MPRLSRRLIAAWFISSVALASAVVPVGAADGIKLIVDVGSPCIEGVGPADTRHEVTLRAPDGRIRARDRDRSDKVGSWYTCFFGQQFISVNAGDRIEVTAGGLSTSLRVPDVLPRIDRDTDVVKGKGPRGGTVRVMVGENTDAARTWTVDVGDNGRWRLDTSDEVDLTGGDIVSVIERRRGDRIRGFGLVPFVVFGPQSNVVQGAGWPGRPVSLELSDDGERRALAAATTLFGSFIALFENARGRAVYPRTGDVLTSDVAGGVALEVPRWNLAGTGLTDTVKGRCMAEAPYLLQIGDGFPTIERRGRTDADGRFTRRIDALKRGQALSLTCFYPGGDQFLVDATAD
jgi:hypothetical protein